jgi:hypothetical protein
MILPLSSPLLSPNYLLPVLAAGRRQKTSKRGAKMNFLGFFLS